VTAVFGVPLPAILGQLMLGLVNGSFYALLSLGLAVIFGLLGVVNFAHGAFYMLGAFAAYIGLQFLGVNYWCALLLAPLAVGLLGIVIERLFLRPLWALRKWNQHGNSTAIVAIRLPVAGDQVALFEVDAQQDVSGGHDREHQVTRRHPRG